MFYDFKTRFNLFRTNILSIHFVFFAKYLSRVLCEHKLHSSIHLRPCLEFMRTESLCFSSTLCLLLYQQVRLPCSVQATAVPAQRLPCSVQATAVSAHALAVFCVGHSCASTCACRVLCRPQLCQHMRLPCSVQATAVPAHALAVFCVGHRLSKTCVCRDLCESQVCRHMPLPCSVLATGVSGHVLGVFCLGHRCANICACCVVCRLLSY